MKKILILLLITLSLTTYAQKNYSIERPLYLGAVTAGTASDSVLVRGADKIVKFVPRSQFGGGTPDLQQVLAQGNTAVNGIVNIISNNDSTMLTSGSLEIDTFPFCAGCSRFTTKVTATALVFSNLTSGESAYIANAGVGIYLLPNKTMALYTLATTDDVKLKEYTVSTLPAGTKGDVAFVSDAASPTFLATVVGGGSAVVRVFHNGTSWIVQ